MLFTVRLDISFLKNYFCIQQLIVPQDEKFHFRRDIQEFMAERMIATSRPPPSPPSLPYHNIIQYYDDTRF